MVTRHPVPIACIATCKPTEPACDCVILTYETQTELWDFVGIASAEEDVFLPNYESLLEIKDIMKEEASLWNEYKKQLDIYNKIQHLVKSGHGKSFDWKTVIDADKFGMLELYKQFSESNPPTNMGSVLFRYT